MKHSIPQLLETAYAYFPHPPPDEEKTTPEYQQRREAHERAGAGESYETWRAMLRRLRTRLNEAETPDLEVQNQSVRLLDPNDAPLDRCYCGALYLPPRRPEEINHRISFRVSFVVPYYYLYSIHQVNTPGDFEYRISFSFSEDETPFVLAVEEEIRRSYPGYEPMSPDVGLTIVPEVATTYQPPGEATLYDCLFTDYR